MQPRFNDGFVQLVICVVLPYVRRSQAGVDSGVRHTLSSQCCQDVSNALVYQHRVVSKHRQYTHIFTMCVKKRGEENLPFFLRSSFV